MEQLKSMKYCHRLVSFVFSLLIIFVLSDSGRALGGDAHLRIGVLAVRGMQQCLESWSPTADYLSGKIGRKFMIVPLSHDQIARSVEKGEVDFILANSAFYVELEHWYQASRIATLKEKRSDGVYTKYGGVIFCRRDRMDIRTLQDLKGKSFMAVSESSLGGWLMAWREFRENGIDPYSDFRELRFNETHDQVVYAVRDRLVDAGTVRTNTLEALSSEGKINMDDYYVFPKLHDRDLKTPYLCTTREYPDWPMARVRHTPEELAEKVAVALLQMPPDSPAAKAASSAGWTIPLNYQPVHDCLRVLKVGPYKDLGKITIRDVFNTYGYWILAASALFFILAAFTVMILKLNRRIETSNVRLKSEMELRQQKECELEHAKDLAETATRAKSEFLANMSHEIRTPMNGVIAATDLALGEELSPATERYLKIIQSSAYSLLGIINDILDFSKIEAGKFELKERVFRLNEVFDQVMELFVNRASEKGIELLVDIDSDAPRQLRGDPLRLQQILTNLVSNAVKFTESGGIILVHVGIVAESGDLSSDEEVRLSFYVKDTGCGIAPEYIDLLFEPFTQADTSSTRRYEGTGLGLSICRQLVTMMGGTIGVESRTGEGSRFFFTVRLSLSSEDPLSRPVIPCDIQGLNVLVVDDLPDSRLIMGRMLESMGFRVETAASGPEALKLLQDGNSGTPPVELVMMDWKMPEMDGIEVSEKIRKELKLDIPIIMMTAFGREEERIAAEKAGVNGFLIKPIYSSTLFDAIMDGLGKGRRRVGDHGNHFTTRASIYRKLLKGSRILVAEDNPTNQQVAQAILEKGGIRVTIVDHGQAAVEAVQNQMFDAVLMDIQMPVMNGYDATRLIRELPEGKSIPIIAMTAHAMKGDEEKCLEAGMDGYVSKPVNQDRLFHTLWRLLRIHGESPEWGSANGDDDPPMENEMRSEEIVERKTDDSAGESGEIRDTLPDEVPGINIREIRAATGIDDPTLMLIMIGFLSDNLDCVKKMRQAYSDHDILLLRHLAHSLKGSAANIGASEVSRRAHALEKECCKESDLDLSSLSIEGLISEVEDALNQVFASIQSIASSSSEEKFSDPSAAEPHGADTAAAQLMAAIDQADPEEIMKSMSIFGTALSGCRFSDHHLLKKLEEQIRRYDYDQALETVHEIHGILQGES